MEEREMKGKKLSRRAFLSTAIVAAAGGVAAACRPSTPEPEPTQAPAQPAEAEASPTPVPAPEAVSVSFMVPGTPTEDEDFAPVFEEFNERYDEIEGVYSPAGTGYTDAYMEKVLTMIAGGVATDTFKVFSSHFGALADKGTLVALDDYTDAYPDITYMDDFFQAHVEACKYQGKLYALPNDGAPTGYWYNVDLYEEAGLEKPSWEWTWEDLRERSMALTKQESGITIQHGTGRPIWHETVWSNGGQVLNEDATKCLLDQPDAVEALQWMQDLAIEDQVIPSPESLSEQNQGQRFQIGRLGGHYGSRGTLGGHRSIEGFVFDAGPTPLSFKDQRMTVLRIGYTSVWTGSLHPDEAYKLAAWICSPEGQRLRISRGFAHPSRKSLVQEEWYRTYECPNCGSYGVNTTFPDTLLRGEAMAWPVSPKDTEIFQIVNTQLDYLWDGSKTGEEVAQDITEQVDQVLAE
jgi:multiple sugar transport system substrate-binding protein